MVSTAIPPLASFKWPPALKFSGEIPAKFEALIAVYRQISTFFWLDSGVSVISFILYSVSAWILFLYSSIKKKIDQPFIPAAVFEADESTEGLTFGPMEEDAFSQGILDEMEDLTFYDAHYAEEIQFHEALLASIFNSQIANNIPSSSVERLIVAAGPANSEDEPDNSSGSFCEICLEDKASWQMFRNDKCSHSFCYDCTTRHIIAKIQDKAKQIPCPALNCKVELNFDACRLIIPNEALVQWDESLCMSLIPDSEKIYCPFRDCSAMLVNDSGEVVRMINCLACKRSFCAECCVPWHSDFTCKEFKKLYAKKGGKEDKIVKTLAKKKNWQKCPKCKMYVEKAEGCVHITCRCRYEFCYRCGSKWSDSHGNCRPKS